MSSLDPSIAGTSVSFTATVSPAVNGGTLTFTLDGVAMVGCSAIRMGGLDGVDCSALLGRVGAHTVAASYSGDRRFANASAFVTQTVVAPPTGSPSSSSTQGPVGVVIDASPSATTQRPTIAYTETGPVTSAACTIDGVTTPCGATSTTLSKLAVGPHTFEITVSGGGATATAEVSWVVLTSAASGSAATKPGKDPPKPRKHRKAL